MHINFFNQNELNRLNKQYKIVRLILLFCILVFATVFTLLLVFASYDNKALFIVIGVSSLTIVVWVIIYLLFFIKRLSKNRYLYGQILNGKITKLNGVITYVGDYSITITSSIKVFEIRLMVKNCVFNLYLLDCFDKSYFNVDKKISVDIVSEYIHGVTTYEK